MASKEFEQARQKVTEAFLAGGRAAAEQKKAEQNAKTEPKK